MDFKHKFEVETGQGIYSGEGQIIVNGTYNDAYVDWLEQQLHLARVSQQRELLIAFKNKVNENCSNADYDIQDYIVDDYLSGL